MKKILLVDDEPNIVEFLKYNLESNGFDVIEASSGWEAIAKLRYKPDLVVLDIMMPGMDGFEVFDKMRELEDVSVPVIFLTAKTSEVDEVKALDMGAVDYIYKPISPQKFIARINAIINTFKRKAVTEKHRKITIAGPLEIDTDSFTVAIGGNEEFFPRKEFQLLKLLADNPGKVFTRKSLMNSVWGEMHYGVIRTVDVHISKIRERLGDYSYLIATVKGVGYKFKED